MKRLALLPLALLPLLLPLTATAQLLWVEGTHYERIDPAVPTSTPGKVEVTEIFSYGCTYCNQAQPYVDRLKASLPSYAQLALVPASFVPTEGWPVYQRAYLTAKALGIAEQNHQAMFDAIWETGELAVKSPTTGRPPTIADIARFYARQSHIKEADFVARSEQPDIDAQMHHADELVKAYHIPGTPAFVVNGRYRLGPQASSWDELIKIINFLVAQEHARMAAGH